MTCDHVGSSVQAPRPAGGLPPVGGNRGHPRSHCLPDVYEQPGNQQPDVQLERVPQSRGGESAREEAGVGVAGHPTCRQGKGIARVVLTSRPELQRLID